MPKIWNVDCTINTDAGQLQEYWDPTLDEGNGSGVPTMTAYIQATEGQQFSINITVHNGQGILPEANVLVMAVSLDGGKPNGRDQVTRPLCHSSFPTERVIEGHKICKRDGTWNQALFTFSKLVVIEDGPSLPTVASEILTKDLGEIKVFVMRGIRGKKMHDISSDIDLLAPRTVTEKMIKGKGLEHAITFSEPAQVEQFDTWYVDYFDTLAKPYMIFRFLYRSKTFLQHLGLIPYSLSSPPLPKHDEESFIDDGTLTREELVAELQRVMRERKPKYKRERDDSPPQSAYSTSKKIKCETIDLTKD